MTVLKYDQMEFVQVRNGVERRMGHTDHLMMTIIDFDDGPQGEPDPPHAHPHEQVTYVAEGEILFFLEEEASKLSPGDLFMVPSNKSHSIQLLSGHVRLVDCFYPLREDFLEKQEARNDDW